MRQVQEQIDFDRGSQLAILREFAKSLPEFIVSSDGKRIRKSYVVALVRCIDDHAGKRGWCTCSAKTLVDESGCGSRTVWRIVGWLKDNNYLICTQTQKSNRYQLVWSNLKPESEIPLCPEEIPLCPESVPLCPGASSTVPSGGTQSAVKRPSATSKEAQIGNRRRRRRNFSFEEIEFLVDRINRTVWVSKPNDFWLVHRVAAMVQAGDIPENDLETVLETMRCQESEIDVSPAYLRRSLTNRCFEGNAALFESAASAIRIHGRERKPTAAGASNGQA